MFVYFPAKELEGNPSLLGLEYQDLEIGAKDGVRLHGWFVPFRLGRRLYDLAVPPKEFYEVSGAGHNDLIEMAGSEYLNRLRSFLEMIGTL